MSAEKSLNDGAQPNENWEAQCARLSRECEELREKLRNVEEERDQYLKAVCALTREVIEFDEEKALARVGKGQSLEELIDELEAQGN